MTASPPGIAEIHDAAARLSGLAVLTPLLESPVLNERLGGRVLFKPEVLQRTGSFKFRGAYNKIASLSDAERARGVVAFSSGNHAQGVAAAAAMFGARAVIAMPADAPRTKTENVRRMGAEVVPFDRFSQDRAAVVRPWLDEGMALVHFCNGKLDEAKSQVELLLHKDGHLVSVPFAEDNGGDQDLSE